MIDGHGLHRFAREHEVACIAVRNSDAVEHEVIAQIVGMTQRAIVLGLESTSGDIHGIWPFLESGRGVARRRHRSCFAQPAAFRGAKATAKPPIWSRDQLLSHAG
ncbi:hypothetical protein [Bradyrhizobium arachidis]|uniref:hypothetical protein n=1 Tax=Bradyrhizobium arachidis TaxID=858423 RepID=UPI00142E6ED4|nr:hypothetical protein [Bradyrhizobium arachidis]